MTDNVLSMLNVFRLKSLYIDYSIMHEGFVGYSLKSGFFFENLKACNEIK